ncbi:MAG: LCP family protein [Actinomycetota bacterium]|nr:LCP family protein [Actinomycetota bacterium]
MMWAKIALALLLIGGLVVGILNFDVIKTWAAKHYVRMRFESSVITPEEYPEIYEELEEWIGPSMRLNVLFIGVDKGSVPGEEEDVEYFRSDVMILASVDVENKKAVLVSFPRDTKVQITGYGTQKINAAHSYGGAAGAMEVVKEITGMELNGYAEVDFEAFKSIVDIIGGVPFVLEYDILDPKVGALGKGYHDLNGEEALIVARSRDLPRGDLDRIDNQKELLKAMMQKAVDIRDIQALLDILDAAVKYLETTMEPDMLFTLAEALQGMEVDQVKFATLPGDSPEPRAGQPWYYVYDEVATATLFNNIKQYCSVESPYVQMMEEKDEPETEVPEVDRVSISLTVLNGARWEGLAGNIADILEYRGYSDIETGNTNNPYDKTTVYYAAGYENEARAVAADLDPEADYVIEKDDEVTGSYRSQVVLVIGDDYI